MTAKADQPTLLARLRALPWAQIGTPAREQAPRSRPGRDPHDQCRTPGPLPRCGRGVLLHAARPIKLVRRRRPLRPGGRWRTVTVYAITSLTAFRADPVLLARWIRGHWGIENRLHRVRDVSFDEDRSQIRTAAGLQIMAALRNLAITALRLAGITDIATRYATTPATPSDHRQPSTSRDGFAGALAHTPHPSEIRRKVTMGGDLLPARHEEITTQPGAREEGRWGSSAPNTRRSSGGSTPGGAGTRRSDAGSSRCRASPQGSQCGFESHRGHPA